MIEALEDLNEFEQMFAAMIYAMVDMIFFILDIFVDYEPQDSH